MPDRDRDAQGRARSARPRDGLGRPLPYGATAPAAVPDDLHLDATETLRRAQSLIDSGMPFQAHEVLEARWKNGPDTEREYWQGLAQAAVALTHLRRGNPHGARALALRAMTHLTGSPPMPGAVAVGPLCDQLTGIAAGKDNGLRLTQPSIEETV